MVNPETIELFYFIAKIFFFLAVFTLVAYVYLSLVTMRLAKKIGMARPWLAWIPVANFYLYSRMAGMHWWPVLLLAGLLVPGVWFKMLCLVVFMVFNLIWFWKIFIKVNQPGWWALMPIIPVFGWLIFLVLLGVAAWSGEANKSSVQVVHPAAQVSTRKQNLIKRPPISPRIERVKKLKGALK